jgi:hypothetical protein
MIDYLIINSLLIFGVHAATRQNMALYKPYKVFSSGLLRLFLFLYKDGKRNCIKVKHPDFPDTIDYGIIDSTEKAGNTTAIILKPLFDCPPCMASVWGIPFILIQPLSIWSVVYLFALSGLNYIVTKIFK